MVHCGAKWARVGPRLIWSFWSVVSSKLGTNFPTNMVYEKEVGNMCLSGETLKEVGALYLVYMPEEVKYRKQGLDV